MMNAHRKQIASYNAFRGLCALGILFSHMAYLSEGNNPFWKFVFDHVMQYGSRCTSFFFMMSGFLLAYTWRDTSFRTYFKHKLQRVYPLALCVFILALLCSFLPGDVVNGDMKVGEPLWFFSALVNLIPLKAFIPIESVFYSFHGPSWYISALLALDLLAYPIIKRLHGNHRAKALKYTGGGTILAYVIQGILCTAIDVKDISAARLYIAYVNPYFRIIGEGLLGIMLCECMSEIQRKLKRWNPSQLEGIALSILIMCFVLINWIKSSLWSAWFWAIPFGAVIIAFYGDRGCFSKCLSVRPWQALGDISFELYMTHAFVYEGIPVAAGVVSDALQAWIVAHSGTRFLITLAACLIFACMVHRILIYFSHDKRKESTVTP